MVWSNSGFSSEEYLPITIDVSDKIGLLNVHILGKESRKIHRINGSRMSCQTEDFNVYQFCALHLLHTHCEKAPLGGDCMTNDFLLYL